MRARAWVLSSATKPLLGVIFILLGCISLEGSLSLKQTPVRSSLPVCLSCPGRILRNVVAAGPEVDPDTVHSMSPSQAHSVRERLLSPSFLSPLKEFFLGKIGVNEGLAFRAPSNSDREVIFK